MESLPLRGHAALVTGASRGLGQVIACRLAQAGMHLALLARDGAALEQAVGRVQSACLDATQEIRCYVADLADEAQLDAAAAACLRDFGAIDVLVNNAGIQGPIGPLDRVDWADWRRVLEVNFFAAARLCRLLLPGMRARRRGKIINLSGGGATSPRPDFSAYAAAKCALVRLSETLAEELRGSGIEVNCVAPGAMNTRMLEEVLAAGPEGARLEYERAQLQAQTGGTPPEAAAELVAWLASPASDGITGRLLSARWDNWAGLPAVCDHLNQSDVYTLRRIVPADRGMIW
jgi:3-oxoacyl-[acyl-carrier protein] reductase